MRRVSVVVPVYYNAGSLEELWTRLARVASSFADACEFEFVFVDDGSGDDSLLILRRLGKDDERVRILKLSRNFGSNAAILAGLSYAKGDCAVVISADLQDPPEVVADLVARWQAGGRVVLAARRTRRDPLLSRTLATVFNRLFRWMVFSDFPPNGFDFMLIDRRIVEIIAGLKEKNSYIFGQALWAGFRREVVLYDRAERKHGGSRWTLIKKIKYFIDAFAAFSYVPLRLASSLGALFASLGFLYALVILGLKLFHRFDSPGWASLSVIVLLTSGTQLLLMGILGEYLWRVLDETRRRPAFIVESVWGNEADRDAEPRGGGV